MEMVERIGVIVLVVLSSFKSTESVCPGLECLHEGRVETTEDGRCFCRCQTLFSGVYCEYAIEESMWPSGPYAIPMSMDGCPEPQTHGWMKGYLKIQSNIPLNITILRNKTGGANDEDIDKKLYNVGDDKITLVSLTEGKGILHDIDVIGPYGRSYFQFNFCYKEQGQWTKDSWPDGHYSIYSTTGTCPTGFEAYNHTVLVPSVKYWNSNGYLPLMTIDVREDNNGVVKFLLCHKTDRYIFINQETESNLNVQSIFRNYPFVFLKYENRSCPNIEGFYTSEATLSIHPASTSNYNTSSGKDFMAQDYCCFRPKFFPVDNNEDCMDESQNYASGSIIMSKNMVMSDATTVTWFLVDLTRTVKVIGIKVEVRRDVTTSELDFLSIYISNDQRIFLSHGAQICRYWSVQSVNPQPGFILEFRRVHEGKYISLFDRDQKPLSISNIEIMTCQKINYQRSCHSDLGMTDEGIEHFQISASSWQTDYPPDAARPLYNGWCASITDSDPYIQVDLHSPTVIEGLVIFNWFKILEGDKITFQKTVLRMGIGSFYITYGMSSNVTHMYGTNTFSVLADTEPQTILFVKPFLARYVRLHPRNQLSHVGICLKFELLGCRKLDGVSLVCNEDNKSRRVVQYDTLNSQFIPSNLAHIGDTYDISWEVCMSRCLEKADCGTAMYSYNNCELLMQSATNVYILYIKTFWTKFMGMLVCLTDAAALNPSTYKTSGVLTTSNTVDVQKEGVITSHGFPFTYETNQIFRWHIKLTQKAFITLSFSHISLHKYKDSESSRGFSFGSLCTDTIQIEKKKLTNDNEKDPETFVLLSLDHTHNDDFVIIPTDLRELDLTFVTCSLPRTRTYKGNGFRVELREDENPTCFVPYALHSRNCFYKYGYIRSFSFCGLFDYITQTWRLTVDPGMIIALDVLDFNVPCGKGSTFKITDMVKDMRDNYVYVNRTYCNTNRPVGLYLSNFNVLLVQFTFKPPVADFDNEHINGFWAHYKTRSPLLSTENITTFEEVFTIHMDWMMGSTKLSDVKMACSRVFNKCYYIFPASTVSWKSARDICLERGFRLTSLHSEIEMRYVRSLLVEFAMRNQMPLHLAWFAFIGLSRNKDADNRLTEKWEDGSHLSFTAWDNNAPPDFNVKLCTYMNFGEVNNNHTWASVECSTGLNGQGHDLFGYFVCDHKGLQKYNNILLKDKVYLHEPLDTFKNIQVTLFQCGSGEWIQKVHVCNTIPECLDRSDEQNCSYTDLADAMCAYDEFRCTSGSCIPVTSVCDFVDDCEDGLDEFCDIPDCTTDEFRCDNGECVPVNSRCDAFVDCLDESDEIDCFACNDISDSFNCAGEAKCLPNSVVCDNYQDCVDGSDEKSCVLSFETCSNWWEAGYRTNGTYTLLGKEVECMFKEVDNMVQVRSVLYNIERSYRSIEGVAIDFRHSGLNHKLESCYIKTRKTCQLHMKDMPELYRLTKCVCIDWNAEIPTVQGMDLLLTIYNLFENNTNGTLCSDTSISIVLADSLFLEIERVGKDERWIDGPVKCEVESQKYERTFGCLEGNKVTSTDKLCLYDHDRYGYIDGCRSLLHLQNCEQYTCPIEYMKCPNSYCLAIRFVCDGEIHCPGGQDEINCWCNAEGTVAVLYHQSTADHNRQYILNLARQFKPVSVLLVRILETEYEERNVRDVSTPFNLNITLNVDITPVDIDYFTDITKSVPLHNDVIIETRFTTLASDLVSRLTEHNLNGTRKGIVYIKDIPLTQINHADLKRQIIPNVQFGENISVYHVSLNVSQYKEVLRTSSRTFTDIKLRRWDTLGRIGSTLFPEICVESEVAVCTNGYRCGKSRVCLPFKNVCDGYRHCLSGDDELYCDIKCPKNCSCLRYSVDCQGRHWDVYSMLQISRLTRSLDISQASYGTRLFLEKTKTLPFIVKLNVSRGILGSISQSNFRKMINLISLDLSFNRLKSIGPNTFRDLKHLKELLLNGNTRLQYLATHAFLGLESLTALIITGSKITQIKSNAFAGLRLSVLDLSQNNIKQVDNFAFDKLDSYVIDIQDNDISVFDTGMFAGITSLESLRTPAFKFCCLRPGYLNESKCTPLKDEFSSCDDLMRNSALQTLMWLVGLSALVGNITSLIYRLAFDRERLKLGYGIFVTNLAVADFMMGAYIIIIAIADLAFRNRYMVMDEYWRSSNWCNMAGILSTVSSEASVLLMFLITVDRVLVIKYPFGQFRFGTKSAMHASLLCWFIALIIAVVPLLHYDYFQNNFYTVSAVCIALPLTKNRPPGWVYSMVIFVGFNFVTFILIATGLMLIFLKGKETKLNKVQAKRNETLKVTRNVLFVVTTDFLCWFPIGILGMMALSGYPTSGDVYAWTAVIILPINSALNPFLYTLSAMLGNKSFVPSTNEQTMDLTFTDNMIGYIWGSRSFGRNLNQNMDGEKLLSLKEVTELSWTMTFVQRIKFAMQLAGCIAYLHKCNIIYGDLSDSSVLMVFKENTQEFVEMKLIVQPTIFTGANRAQQKSELSMENDISNMGIILKQILPPIQRLTGN